MSTTSLPRPRMSQARRMVVTVLINRPEAEHYAYALAKDAKLTIVTVASILKAFGEWGYLTSHVEEINALAEGRPPRRLYRVNPSRLDELKALVA